MLTSTNKLFTHPIDPTSPRSSALTGARNFESLPIVQYYIPLNEYLLEEVNTCGKRIPRKSVDHKDTNTYIGTDVILLLHIII